MLKQKEADRELRNRFATMFGWFRDDILLKKIKQRRLFQNLLAQKQQGKNKYDSWQKVENALKNNNNNNDVINEIFAASTDIGIDEKAYRSFDLVRGERNDDAHSGLFGRNRDDKLQFVEKFNADISQLANQSSLFAQKNNFLLLCDKMKTNL